MFISAVCVLFLIKLRWPNNKSLYDTIRNAFYNKIVNRIPNVKQLQLTDFWFNEL